MISKIRKALVLAPHPDDELNIAGQVMPRLVAAGVDCYICFSTNGDYAAWQAPTRHAEALESARRMGIPASHVLFLGYGDVLCGPHVYTDGGPEVVVSHSGHVRAYVPGGKPFSETICGEASLYTREAFIGDIRTVVEYLLADLVICVDYDSHPDHKALSLGFERAMAEILDEGRGYRPVVLKKFAYASSWKGPEDYWSFSPSAKPDAIADGYPYELPNPTYSWDERLRVAPDPSTLTPSLRRNALFKAARAHRTQLAWAEAQRICNGDVIYWLRRTDNLLREGRISATSGDVSAIDGFSRFEVGDISLGFSCGHFLEKGWRPEEDDETGALSVDFADARMLAEARITASPSSGDLPDFVSVAIDGRPLEAYRIGLTCCYGLSGLNIACEKFEVRLGRRGGFAIEAIELYGDSTCDCELLESLETVLPLFEEPASREQVIAPPFARARLSILHAHAFLARHRVRVERGIRKLAYTRLAAACKDHAASKERTDTT